MNYKFQVEASAFDFFKMYMKKVYSSPIGVCNAVFFLAVLFTTVKLYGDLSDWARAMFIFACLIFPLIQPFGVYMNSRSLAGSVPDDMSIETCKEGLLVRVGEQAELVSYSRIKRVVSTHDCVIINTAEGRGYVLFNKVLGDQKDNFTRFLSGKVE